jgi:hypothetical protein
MITTAAPTTITATTTTTTTTTTTATTTTNNNNLGVQGVCILFYDTTSAIMIIQRGTSLLRRNTM